MKVFVRDLEPNQMYRTNFLVHAKEVRQKKTGEPFLSLTVGDKSGDIDAKMWDNVADVLESFGVGDFIKVKGVMSLYNGRPQFTIHTLDRVDEDEVQLPDYFPASQRDPEEMYTELIDIVHSMGNPHLKALLLAFFDDDSIRERYKKAPSAKQIHHAFLGGLLEHVLSLCSLCKLVGPHYPVIDLDLLLTGAILHDIGKIDELTYQRSLGYSEVGQLLGHISIGVRYLHDKLREVPEFPPALAVLVEHMVLSHHGKLEFGSPKVPAFPEALLLHYLDDMDSKMECMRAHLERDENTEAPFTSFNYAMDRVFLKKDRFLGVVPEVPAGGTALPAPGAGAEKQKNNPGSANARGDSRGDARRERRSAPPRIRCSETGYWVRLGRSPSC